MSLTPWYVGLQGYDNTGQLDGKPEVEDEVQFSDDEQVCHRDAASMHTSLSGHDDVFRPQQSLHCILDVRLQMYSKVPLGSRPGNTSLATLDLDYSCICRILQQIRQYETMLAK